MLLFVCGFPSGGTDLTKTILNAHPEVFLNGEMPRLPALARHGYHSATVFRSREELVAFQRTLERLNTWDNIANLRHDFAPLLAQRGQLGLLEVLKVMFADRDRRVWGNKTPQNTESIQALYSVFPEARFLIVTRDVRDVCLSWRSKWNKDMTLCAHKWASRMQAGQRQATSLPIGQTMFVRYEDILTDLELFCRQVCEFLDLPFSARMLEHHRHTSEAPDGKLKYGQRVDPLNRDKWQRTLPEQQVERIEEIAYDTMLSLGYVPAIAKLRKQITVRERALGYCNDTWASLIVGNRSSRGNTLALRLRSIVRQIGSKLAG